MAEPTEPAPAPTTPAPPTRRLARTLTVLGLAVAGGFALGRFTAPAPPAAAAAARVNGEVISRQEFDQQLERRFGSEVLRDLITQRLIAQAAQKQKIVISEQQLQNRLKAVLSEPEVAAMIRSGRIREEDVKRNLSTLMPLDALVLAAVTPDDEKAYFKSHRHQLQSVHLRHIQVASREEAEDLKSVIESGGDFAALAREHSLDPASKDSGGDLGTLRSSEVEPAVAEAAFKLEPGKTSAVVETGLGYHLFQVVERKGDYTTLRGAIREAMAAPRRAEFVEALRKQARIETELPIDLSAREPDGRAPTEEQ